MPRFKVAYTPEALQEIKRIVEWYNDASPGLGERFKKNLLSEITAIKKIHIPSRFVTRMCGLQW